MSEPGERASEGISKRKDHETPAIHTKPVQESPPHDCCLHQTLIQPQISAVTKEGSCWVARRILLGCAPPSDSNASTLIMSIWHHLALPRPKEEYLGDE